MVLALPVKGSPRKIKRSHQVNINYHRIYFVCHNKSSTELMFSVSNMRH